MTASDAWLKTTLAKLFLRAIKEDRQAIFCAAMEAVFSYPGKAKRTPL